MEELKRNFLDMDEDGSGDIDVVELGRAMEKLGKPKNQLQLRKMIAEVDISGSGTIEYEEFVLMMIGSSSSVLRLILLFEKLSKKEETGGKSRQKKPMINLLK
jgi:allograft inflammatory factor 1